VREPTPYRERLQMRLQAAYFGLHRRSDRNFALFDRTADFVWSSYLADEGGRKHPELSC